MLSRLMFLLEAIRETKVVTCLDNGHTFLSKDLRMLHVNDNSGEATVCIMQRARAAREFLRDIINRQAVPD